VLIGGLLGVQFGTQYTGTHWWGGWFLAGIAAGLALVFFEVILHSFGRGVSVRGFSAGVFGLLFGLIMAKMVSDAVALTKLDAGVVSIIKLCVTWSFAYIGMVVALRGRDEFNVVIPYVRLSRQDRSDEIYLVDTSAIIDGRITDLCKTRFLEGRILIPRFVLKELQTIADSNDPMKRARGRRGLDVLNGLRSQPNLDIHIHDEDIAGVAETDSKLVRLAKIMGARVVTTDYNLNKIAQLQGVGVLNVNELAQALRPVILPGELLEVRPMKEGKEANQSVAYLDDGTMVVVEGGRHLIGQTVQGLVTSVLQTAAGRMVFVRPDASARQRPVGGGQFGDSQHHNRPFGNPNNHNKR
jgi:uncharacterized protein YacL